MEETNNNYQSLKKNIKDFIRTQNIDKKKNWSFIILFVVNTFRIETFLSEISYQ